MDFSGEVFGRLFLTLLGVVGSLLSLLVFLLRRWMKSVEDSVKSTGDKMHAKLDSLHDEIRRLYVEREPHQQVHTQLQDAINGLVMRDNVHEARLREHGERLLRLEKERRGER